MNVEGGPVTGSVAPPPAAAFVVKRWTRQSAIASGMVALVCVLLVFVPYMFGINAIEQLTSLFILAILAAMWNALAGYGGLVSVGQQAFIGLGAYGTILFVNTFGLPPYLAMILAALAAGVVAVPISLLVLRLRGGQFAIGTWVVAEVLLLLALLDTGLGGGTGTSLQGMSGMDPLARQAYTYWLTLGFGVLLLGLVFWLLRSRNGASLQAIRDDEDAAASLGVPVLRSKRLLFVVASFGCGAAGALTLANTLFIQPQSIFGVQWTAYMIFMVLVGGLGTFEGPIIGAVVFFVLQNQFADSGAWYLIGLGATAIGFALFLPQGIWGLVERRLRVQLLPVGYQLQRRTGAGHGVDAG
jgi:branched-chain amino acid transport system permease protein